MKTKTIEDLETENTSYRNLSEIAGEQGFWREIIVKDYAENNPGATSGLVKKVTVRVQYKFKKETESVELSTIISKEI